MFNCVFLWLLRSVDASTMQMGEGYCRDFKQGRGGRRVLVEGFFGIVYYCLKNVDWVNGLVDSG